MASLNTDILDLDHDSQLMLEEHNLNIGDILKLEFSKALVDISFGVVIGIPTINGRTYIPGFVSVNVFYLFEDVIKPKGSIPITRLNSLADWSKLDDQ